MLYPKIDNLKEKYQTIESHKLPKHTLRCLLPLYQNQINILKKGKLHTNISHKI